MTVQSASVSESWAIDHKAPEILTQLSPQTLTADDAYTQASRIRRWAKSQVALITPALRWTKGRYAIGLSSIYQPTETTPALEQTAQFS